VDGRDNEHMVEQAEARQPRPHDVPHRHGRRRATGFARRQPSSPRRTPRSTAAVVIAAVTGVLLGVTVDHVAVDVDQRSPVTTSAPAATDPIPTDGGSEAFLAAEASLRSVVAIDVITVGSIDGLPSTEEFAGSGFVYATSGLIATNAHVIDAAVSIEVRFADGTTVRAKVVATDERADLALVHVDRGDLWPLQLGVSSSLRVGEPVIAIGNALSLDGALTASSGIVSALDRTVTTEDGATYDHLVQTDAAINPGDSGGPLLDAAGRVVGINVVAVEDAQNIGFAIPIDAASEVLAELAERAGR
jgi:S1-C subfamily serine protease